MIRIARSLTYDDYEARLRVYVYLATTLMDIPFMGRYSHTWITYDPRFYRLCRHYLSLKKLFVVGLHVHNTFLYNLHHGPWALIYYLKRFKTKDWRQLKLRVTLERVENLRNFRLLALSSLIGHCPIHITHAPTFHHGSDLTIRDLQCSRQLMNQWVHYPDLICYE